MRRSSLVILIWIIYLSFLEYSQYEIVTSLHSSMLLILHLTPFVFTLWKPHKILTRGLASQRIIINNKLSTKHKSFSANNFCFRLRHWCHEFPAVDGMLWPPSTDPDWEARDFSIIAAIDRPFWELKSRTPLGSSLDWINIHDL